MPFKENLGTKSKCETNNKDGEYCVQPSLSNKKNPVHKAQISVARNVTISNSFDALMNEQVLENTRKKRQ